MTPARNPEQAFLNDGPSLTRDSLRAAPGVTAVAVALEARAAPPPQAPLQGALKSTNKWHCCSAMQLCSCKQPCF